MKSQCSHWTNWRDECREIWWDVEASEDGVGCRIMERDEMR